MADAHDAAAQQRAGTRGPGDRPTSPHLQVWRWHVTMAASILHRASIIALYVGALILAGLFVALASGEDAYAAYKAMLGSPPGLLVLFGLTVALIYFSLSNLRHLVWDFGAGFELRTANMMCWLSIILSVVFAVVVWAAALFAGI